MKSFNFRLKSFLKIKAFAEKLALNDVLLQEAKVVDIQSKIHSLELMIENIRKSTSQLGSQRSESANWAQTNNELVNGLKTKIGYLKKDMQAESNLLQKLIGKHTEAKREMKVIELYEKRQYEDYKKEKKVRDNKKMDEITHNYILRRRKNESV